MSLLHYVEYVEFCLSASISIGRAERDHQEDTAAKNLSQFVHIGCFIAGHPRRITYR